MMLYCNNRVVIAMDGSEALQMILSELKELKQGQQALQQEQQKTNQRLDNVDKRLDLSLIHI